MSTAFVAQIMGFFRTKLVNANFNGIGVPPDQNAGIYFAAFVLPDFFFFTVAAGALGVAFMPYLSDRLHRGDRRGLYGTGLLGGGAHGFLLCLDGELLGGAA